MCNELSEDLSSIETIQAETQDSLIKIKNYLQRNNNRLNEGENKINNLEQKEAKNNQSEQQEERRIQKVWIV